MRSLEKKGYIDVFGRDKNRLTIANEYRLTDLVFIEYEKNANYDDQDYNEDAGNSVPCAGNPVPSGGELSTTPRGTEYPNRGELSSLQAPSLAPSNLNPSIDQYLHEKVCAEKDAQFDAPSDKQACPSGGLNDDHIVDQVSQEKEAKPKRTKKGSTKEKSEGSILWDHYASAFVAKYGIEPLKNAKGYSLSSQLVKLAGVDAGRQIIESYFKSTDPFVLKTRHPLGLLVSQIDKFRVDNIRGNDLNANTYMQNRKYVPMRLSHDEAWEEDFVDLVSNRWTDIKAFRARNEKKS